MFSVPGRAGSLLAGAWCVLGQLEVVLSGPDPVEVACAALATLPIAWRRRAPLAAALAVTASWLIFHAWNGFTHPPAFFFFAALPVIYSLGAHARAVRSAAGAVPMLGAAELTDFLGIGDDYAFHAFLIALVWLSGHAARIYRRQTEQLRRLTCRLEAERADCERLAVAEERRRLTAALHGTIEQTIGRMLVDAERAEQSIGREADRVREVLTAVQETGRQAIAQLQQILGLLRTPSTPAVPVPCRDLPASSCLFDLAWAVAVTVAFDVQQVLGMPFAEAPALIAGSAIAACLAMALRRAAPLTAFSSAAATMTGSLVAAGGVVAYSSAAAILVTMYSVVVYASARAAVAAGAATALVVLLGARPGNLLAVTTLVVVVWLCGYCVRGYRDRARQIRTLNTRLAGERDARARLAVLDERFRVARDLHDSIAHAVNVMVLQAGAAEQLLKTAPEAALTAIHAVQAQGRQAFRDLHPLSATEAGDDLSGLGPLIARTGLPVTLHVHGLPARLPEGVSGSAYRVVQEALTNTLKHAGTVPATVTVAYRSESLDIEIRDEGRAGPRGRTGPAGHGLLGMRERTACHGGTLAAGPCPGGGFAVRVHIPLAWDQVPPPKG